MKKVIFTSLSVMCFFSSAFAESPSSECVAQALKVVDIMFSATVNKPHELPYVNKTVVRFQDGQELESAMVFVDLKQSKNASFDDLLKGTYVYGVDFGVGSKCDIKNVTSDGRTGE